MNRLWIIMQFQLRQKFVTSIVICSLVIKNIYEFVSTIIELIVFILLWSEFSKTIEWNGIMSLVWNE